MTGRIAGRRRRAAKAAATALALAAAPSSVPAQAAPASVPAQAAPVAGAAVAAAPGAVVRWLDKISGQTLDIDLTRGQVTMQGRLSIALSDCRYPAADPASNAYAHLTIRDQVQTSGPVFDGWMIADSPALSAMDHPRYDVWLLRCTRS